MLRDKIKQCSYSYLDVHRGLLFVVPILLAYIFMQFFSVAHSMQLWFFLTLFLLAFTVHGESKWQQVSNLAVGLGLFLLALPLAALLVYTADSVWFFVCLSVAVFVLLCAPMANRAWYLPAIIAVIFLLLILPLLPGLHSFKFGFAVLVPMLLALLAQVVVVLCLPTTALPAPPLLIDVYFIKRILRIALAIAVIYAVCQALSLQHAAWAGIAGIVVSQGSLGATLRRSMHRLLGTVLGVISAVPCMLYLFKPYPASRMLIVPLTMLGFIVMRRHYAWTIFLLTLSLGAVYFMIYPAGQVHALHYIIARLYETFLGVAVMIVFELCLFPRSIIVEMRSQSSLFWQKLVLLQGDYMLGASSPNLTIGAHPNFIAAKKYLHDLDLSMQNYRFEPLAFLGQRYHYVCKLLNALHHLLKTMQRLRRDVPRDRALWSELQVLSHRLQQQYEYISLPKRYTVLQQVQVDLQARLQQVDKRDAIYPGLLAYQQVLAAYCRLLAAQSFKLRWR